MLKKLLVQHPAIWRRARKFRKALSMRKLIELERELKLLQFLVPANRTAVDVGANAGIYIDLLSSFTKSVVAIEPNPFFADQIAAMFPEVHLVRAAASDRNGAATLRVPTSDYFSGMATIEPKNQLAHHHFREIPVEKVTVDSLRLPNLGFIKIDVEGHENAVLRGAIETIKACRPNLLIECEERYHHGSISELSDQLRECGYNGYFLSNGTLMPISAFDVDRQQGNVDTSARWYKQPSNDYVNNFIFLPS